METKMNTSSSGTSGNSSNQQRLSENKSVSRLSANIVERSDSDRSIKNFSSVDFSESGRSSVYDEEDSRKPKKKKSFKKKIKSLFRRKKKNKSKDSLREEGSEIDATLEENVVSVGTLGVTMENREGFGGEEDGTDGDGTDGDGTDGDRTDGDRAYGDRTDGDRTDGQAPEEPDSVEVVLGDKGVGEKISESGSSVYDREMKSQEEVTREKVDSKRTHNSHARNAKKSSGTDDENTGDEESGSLVVELQDEDDEKWLEDCLKGKTEVKPGSAEPEKHDGKGEEKRPVDNTPKWKVAADDFLLKRQLAASDKVAFGQGLKETKSRVPLDPIVTKDKEAVDAYDDEKYASVEYDERGTPIPAWKIASRDFRKKDSSPSNAAFGHSVGETKSRVPLDESAKESDVEKFSPSNSKKSPPAWKVASRDFREKESSPSNAAFGHTVGETKSRIPLDGGASRNDEADDDKTMSSNSKSSVPSWKVASRDFRKKSSPTSNSAFGHTVKESKSRVPLDTTQDRSVADSNSYESFGNQAHFQTEDASISSSLSASSSVPAWKAAALDFRLKRTPPTTPTRAAFGHGVDPTKPRIDYDGHDEKSETHSSITPSPSESSTPAWKAASLDFRRNRSAESSSASAFGVTVKETKSRVPLESPKSLGGEADERPGISPSPSSVPAWKMASRDFRRNRSADSTSPSNAAFGHGVSKTNSRVPLEPTEKNKKSSSSVPEWKVASRDFRNKPEPSNAAFGHGVSRTKSRIPLEPMKNVDDDIDGVSVVSLIKNPKPVSVEVSQKVVESVSPRGADSMKKFLERQQMGREEFAKKKIAGL